MALPPGLNFGNRFNKAPDIRVKPNIGGLFDILTGEPAKGKWGMTLINGGLWPTDGIVGPNNSFKSTLSKYKSLAVLNNYGNSNLVILDTEVSGTGPGRYNSLKQHFPRLEDTDFETSDRILYTTNAETYGDDWWQDVKKYAEEKRKKENLKYTKATTPFVDKEGNTYSAFIPTVAEIDSISMMAFKSTDDKFDDVRAGDAKRNTEFMALGRAKTSVVRDMPVVSNSSGIYIISTAHVGEKIEMDPYSPAMKKFALMKGNRTVKGVNEAFLFNINYVWEIVSSKPLLNASTKAPEFPHRGLENSGDTDLMELIVTILRGKGGSTGFTFPLVCSQKEGILEGLSMFYLIKKFDKFGIGGNDRNYFIELYPDCSLSRTTVRDKIDEDAKLRQAIRFTSDLLLLEMFNNDVFYPRERICTPKELYDDIKVLGYDWDELLDTTSTWHFKEDGQTKPTLTIYDLLNIRAGEYKPYWMTEEWKKSKPTSMEP